MDKKRALFLMLFFALIYCLVNLFAIMSVDTNSAQLSSLMRSDYEYSASSSRPVLQDDYFCFNAGITFSTNVDLKKGINAEVLMQSKDSLYTSSVEWNANRISQSGAAITEGIAKAYNLGVGDSIYSKHIVDGTIHEYTIEQVLPDVFTSRYSEKRVFTEGMIIIGFEQAYIDNITHTTLLYTKESINDITLKISNTPVDLIYRSDEIILCVKMLLPYWILFVAFVVVITVLFVALNIHFIKYNFIRLLTLGFDEKTLNRSLYRFIFSGTIPPIFIAFFISIVMSNLFINSSMEVGFLIAILLAELVSLLISASLSKRRLWG